METNRIPDNQLCFVTVVFPVTDDNQIISVKKNIEAAVKDLEKVKVELRITVMRDGSI